MSSQGKKRAGSKQQPPVRQGSSFLKCPACATQVYAPLMQFHLSSCHVVNSTDMKHDPPAKEEVHGTQSTGNSESRGFSTCSRFRQDSGKEQGVGSSLHLMKAQPAASDWGQALVADPGTPIRAPDRSYLENWENWGQRLSPEREYVESLCDVVPVQSEFKRVKIGESREDIPVLSIAVDLGFLPESDGEAIISQLETPPNLRIRASRKEIATEQPFVEDLEITQELERESQGQGPGYESSSKAYCTEDKKKTGNASASNEPVIALPQSTNKYSLAEWRESEVQRSLQEIKDQCEELSRREQEAQKEILFLGAPRTVLELETAFGELREKYATALLKESELQRALLSMKQECEEVRARELEAQNEVLKLRALLSKLKCSTSQAHQDADEVMATQLLAGELNPDASASRREGGEEDFAMRGAMENVYVKHKLSKIECDKQANRLSSQGVNSVSSLGLTCPGQNHPSINSRSLPQRVEFTKVPCAGGHMARQPYEDSILSPLDDISHVRKLFENDTQTAGESLQSRKGPSMSSLQSLHRTVASKLAPQTPGKGLEPVDEHDVIEIHEGLAGGHIATSNVLDHHQPAEAVRSAPGGPQTPEKFSIGIGAREKGFISDLLQSFPPAQGADTQGTHPFHTEFVEAADACAPLQMTDCPKDASSFQAVWTIAREGVEPSSDGKCTQNAGTTPLHTTRILGVHSQDSQEEILDQTRPKMKRKKSALVVDSDSDENIAEEEFSHDLEDAKVSNYDMASSGQTKRSPSFPKAESPCNPTDEKEANSQDPIIEALRMNKRRLLPHLAKALFPDEGKEDISGDSSVIRRKGKLRRLVKLQEAPNTGGPKEFQIPAEVGVIKETGETVLRRSQRLRKVPASEETTVFSENDEESNFDERGNRDSGKSGHSWSLKHDDVEDIDSDSSHSRPMLRRQRNSEAVNSRTHCEVRRDPYGNKLEVDDEYDSSSFINDDPESDNISSCAQSSTTAGYESEIGEGSESSDSVNSRDSLKKHKRLDWELEGDMLAALAKDSKLCLRGLCALYRRQEEDEKQQSLSKYRNKRGFDRFHASKASQYAKFLLGNEESLGPVTKTATQLKKRFGDDAVTYCSDMCSRHSKQLFEIYQNREDPHFCAA